jgi:hypothetical protein
MSIEAAPMARRIKTGLRRSARSAETVSVTGEGRVNVLVSPMSAKRPLRSSEEHVAELSSLQHLHYASNRYALLLIFQQLTAQTAADRDAEALNGFGLE